MNALEFLGLRPGEQPNTFVLPIEPGLATAGRFLFGGCGLGAAISAMESVTGRPVVWATAQYLSFAMVGEVMDIDVVIATDGHFTTQARVVAHVGEREVLTVNAALGRRPLPWSGQWGQPPTVPPPEDCVHRASRWDVTDTIMERLDLRVASARQWEDLDGTVDESGRSSLWVKVNDLEAGTLTLAILGDYVPYGIAQALGRWTRSNSLDNTLRIVNVVETEWVLVDIEIHGVRDGFGHGLVHLWSQDGVLMATASQSSVVRPVDEAG